MELERGWDAERRRPGHRLSKDAEMGNLGGDRCLGLGGGGSEDQGLRMKEGGGSRKGAWCRWRDLRLGLVKNEAARVDAGGWRPPGFEEGRR